MVDIYRRFITDKIHQRRKNLLKSKLSWVERALVKTPHKICFTLGAIKIFQVFDQRNVEEGLAFKEKLLELEVN